MLASATWYCLHVRLLREISPEQMTWVLWRRGKVWPVFVCYSLFNNVSSILVSRCVCILESVWPLTVTAVIPLHLQWNGLRKTCHNTHTNAHRHSICILTECVCVCIRLVYCYITSMNPWKESKHQKVSSQFTVIDFISSLVYIVKLTQRSFKG